MKLLIFPSDQSRLERRQAQLQAGLFLKSISEIQVNYLERPTQAPLKVTILGQFLLLKRVTNIL